MKLQPCLTQSVILALAGLAATAGAVTVEDFDADVPTPAYVAKITNSPPGPERLAGGPTGLGKFLRLVTRAPQPPPASSNTITFPVTDATPAQTIVAEFDFRILCGATRGDGFGFTLLDAAKYPAAAVEPDREPFAVEEPSYAGSLGVGFDIFANDARGTIPADSEHAGIRANFSSSVSVHFDGKFLAQVDTTAVTDLANGQWLRARIVAQAGGSAPKVTVLLAATAGQWVTLLQQPVRGLKPYVARAHFGARSGGETADVDLDNLSIAFLQAAESALAFTTTLTEIGEEAGAVVLTVARTGNVSAAASVAYAASGGSATADVDFTAATGTLNFLPKQTTATITIPILDDAATENEETFTVALANPTGGAVLGETRTTVRILDDEAAAAQGRWSAPIGVGVAGVHTALLPTGRLLLLDRVKNRRLWDPATLAVSTPAAPPGGANLFCSGHCYLPDGSLLIVGGHDDHGGVAGGPEHDGFGLATALRYVAATNGWTSLPKMKGGRWYPTITALANGDVLALSGSTSRNSSGYIQNTLPEVWQLATQKWQPLTNAAQQQATLPAPGPQGFDLYPRVFLAPDGRAFKIGADQDCWYLDATGAGVWSPGPRRIFGVRGYGAAVMYEPGKILYVGGGDPPTATVEIIDLNTPAPEWRAVGSMSVPRRQLNATVLPDGSVLVTGGSRNPGPDADGVADSVFTAELWSPATEQWTTLAAMDIARLYHSTALLLPDGRVCSAGGGHSSASTSFHNEAELFSPPYLFKGPRPAIASAPGVLTYGQTFFLQTPDAAAIASACLLRLGAVTHSFDQNARRVPLTFSRASAGLLLASPAAGTIAPPGHYLLFLVNGSGVPSVARTVQLALESPVGIFRGLISSDPASNASAGVIQLSVNSQGAFTATIVLGGRSQALSGVFDPAGDFSTTIAGAVLLAVQLHRDSAGITGSLTRAGLTGTFTAERTFTTQASNPAPPHGAYTVQLPHPADPLLPQGHGYGTLVVTPAGLARFAGVLGDGTRVSHGSTLTRTGAWPLYVPLYASKGSLSGEVRFDDTMPASDVQGVLDWFRPPMPTAPLYPAGFGTEVALTGSRYLAPPRGVRVLAFADIHHNGVFQTAGGNLTPAPGAKTVSLETTNRVTIHESERFTFTITLSSGLFTGSFVEPATGGLRSFGGALLQKPVLGAGTFTGRSATGSVELLPVQ